MAATPETLALAMLVILYFLLTAAELFLCARRSQQRRWKQQVLQPPPADWVAPLATPFAPESEGQEDPADEGGREKQPQRRRRRARRKRQQHEGAEGEGAAAAPSAKAKAAGKGEPLLPQRPQFPLASVAGSLQQRINERYDDLARASEAQCLTIEQVNEFLNCLIDARNDLQQRHENVQRSLKIKKAMLSNHQNYRCSYDRLYEQVRRLEIECDNLMKDAATYNFLQERLQVSKAYKLIMELSAMEMEDDEISFEELLAQEKEDTAFWQRDGKMRSTASK